MSIYTDLNIKPSTETKARALVLVWPSIIIAVTFAICAFFKVGNIFYIDAINVLLYSIGYVILFFGAYHAIICANVDIYAAIEKKEEERTTT